jgi:hypothetical protein
MDTQRPLNADERSAIMMRGNTWAYNFLLFALLIDVVYQSLLWHEAAWDLLALLIASGLVSVVYAVRHKVLVLNRNFVMVMSLVALLSAVIAAAAALTLTIM